MEKTLQNTSKKIRNVYVGYDTRLDTVYNVCEHSIRRNSNVNVIPLIQSELRHNNLYYRGIDKLASTEFTITRFLVPTLNQFKGWALFCDCDFLFTIDVNEVFDLAEDKYAVMVVKHNYTPKTNIKMDNKHNHSILRKNWSSFILYNCEHHSNKKLDTTLVNTAAPEYLHRFMWLDDEYIGELDHTYNWLVGYYNETLDIKPKILHYTDGGPWFDNYSNVEYHDMWKKEYELYRSRQ